MFRRSAAIAALAAVAGATALTGTGWATSASAAGSHYSVMTARVGSQTEDLRWNPCQAAITYKVNVELASEDGNSSNRVEKRAENEIVQAMAKVSAATGITFHFEGRTKLVPSGSGWSGRQDANDEIVIAYVRPGSGGGTHSSLLGGGAWGSGGQSYKTWGSQLAVGRGFVVLDSRKTAGMNPGFGRGTHRGNLVLHEMGHVMGLNHVNDSGELMDPVITSRTPNGYAAGDRAGLKRLGASKGCIAGASRVWSGS